MREFSVLLTPAADVKNQWVAHCLNWDLVSQGNSPSHAARMIFEAIALSIEQDSADGLDPAERPPAPTEMWELFQRIQQGGTRIASADIDTIANKAAAIASVMYVGRVGVRLEQRPHEIPLGTPPPFMIAEFPNHNAAHRS